MVETILQILILFAEPGFPQADGVGPQFAVPGARVATSVEALVQELSPPEPGVQKVLVWRHGGAFPAEAWPALLRFLEGGGSLLHLGGEPFTRPVTGPAGARRLEPRTVALLKELRLNQSYRVPVAGGIRRFLSGSTVSPRDLGPEAWVAVLEPRLSDTRDFSQEDGAPGSRDGIVRPLAHIFRPTDDRRFPAAAGSFAIDRLRGRYSGGRWVFHLVSEPPTVPELGVLLEEASRPAGDLRVDPLYGCFHEGERPAVRLSVHRPRAVQMTELAVELEVTGPAAESRTLPAVKLRGRTHGSIEVPLLDLSRPGLYRITARTPGFDPVTTGFWIFDEALFTSGDALTFDRHTLRRNDRATPVIGTTTMSGTVHRKFLFEPNAAVWDDTFEELASIGVNLVRTGIWSAYKKISLDPHVVDEAWLRALEAYYLSARRHGIPIVFTFFAFVPETFGGENPYFDPRALEGQKAYVATVVRRFARTREMLWDLINEPSFSSPDKLWACRPHGDRHEAAAFRAWLQARYAADGSWEDRVRARWRLRPDEPIGLPTDDDFADRHHMGEHRPYRAKEYAHFAQDAFEGWVRTLSQTIRDAGSPAAITVGQDEGGLHERPSPLTHHRSVDYTSIHTWWYNDALLWDGLLAKAPGKPLLVSETGVMQRELLSGTSIRTPGGSARLLARKIGHAFASGAFGLVEWCYEVNPYMASDNEVGIGLKRVDGSYKPEHAVLREFGRFFGAHGHRLDGFEEPEVVLVFPSSDHYSPRGFQTGGTRRALEIAVEDLGVPVQVISEHRIEDLGQPRVILLPACRGLSDSAWEGIARATQAGATLLCSGYFETDDAGLPALRLGSTPRPLAHREPLLGGTSMEGTLRYPLAVTESWFASRSALTDRPWGAGRIVHVGPPLEWAAPDPVQRSIYERALAGIPDAPSPRGLSVPGLFVRRLEFRDATLIIAINESSVDRRLPLEGVRGVAQLTVKKGLVAMVLLDGGGSCVGTTRDIPLDD